MIGMPRSGYGSAGVRPERTEATERKRRSNEKKSGDVAFSFETLRDKASNASSELAMAWTVPWNLIGMIVSGDIGPLTIYTDRFGRKVPFPRSPPKQPPSAKQSERRSQFRQAVINYMALSKGEKQKWENLTKKLSIPQTGQNLYISLSFSQDNSAFQTVLSQAHMTLALPPAVE